MEIPSRFTGVIKKLHYETGEMAIVGKPLIDIDVQEDVNIDEPAFETAQDGHDSQKVSDVSTSLSKGHKSSQLSENENSGVKKGKLAALATPAVRHLTKELDVNITDVDGTGRDGRVLKDDVYKFVEMRGSNLSSSSEPTKSSQLSPSPLSDEGPQTESIVQLTNMQSQMFKTMSRSLSIPHFLYADEVDISSLSELRSRLNKSLAKASNGKDFNKLSFLPFIIKAMSLSLHQYPILNARVDIDPDTSKPTLAMRTQHNIGIAMDTPQGLLVPVMRNVAARSIDSIGLELSRLQALAMAGKLTTADLSGGTITLSNIGNIGGTYVSPVIVDKEVSILGIGKMRTIPAFDDDGNIVKKQICNFSWSADHRVVDGATMARAAEVVRNFVEAPDSMMVHMR